MSLPPLRVFDARDQNRRPLHLPRMSDPSIFTFETIHACQIALGYTFENPLYLHEALLAAGSYLTLSSHPRFSSGNKRLAILGDRILDLLLALHWYPTWEERVTFDIGRNNITSNANLDAVGRRNGLDRFVTLAVGARAVTQKTMTATVEAVVGAAYLDGGMEAAEKVVEKLGIFDQA